MENKKESQINVTPWLSMWAHQGSNLGPPDYESREGAEEIYFQFIEPENRKKGDGEKTIKWNY